jgi:hypothetical protein
MVRDIASDPHQRVRSGRGRSIIAVIGIDKYLAWPALSNAVNDANGVSQLFQRLGFIELTPPLLNGAATREAMWRLVTDDLAKLDSTDSLVLFFAGHGHTRVTYPDGNPTKIGYVVPVDAAEDRAATWVRLDFWLNEVALLPPRHILVIVDACHSGVALDAVVKWRGAALSTAALDDRPLGGRPPARLRRHGRRLPRPGRGDGRFEKLVAIKVVHSHLARSQLGRRRAAPAVAGVRSAP